MNAPASISAGRLVRSTTLALFAAGAILLVAVLPAEYGIDPSGLGRLLGLTPLGDARLIAANQPAAQVMHAHPRKFHSADLVIEIEGHGELEYKATLAAGEPLLYSWRVQGGPVYVEFHGEPTAGKWPQGYYRSYQINERSMGEHGSFVAPFSGQHGWYWRNPSAQRATVRLQASGYYSRLGRIESTRATTE